MQMALEIVSHGIFHFTFYSQLFCLIFDFLFMIHIEVLKILESHHPDLPCHLLVIEIWLHFIFLQEIHNQNFLSGLGCTKV